MDNTNVPIFFVGGTGQHILLSYAHMCRLANFKMTDEFILFDGDVVPEDREDKETLSQQILDFFTENINDYQVNPNPGYLSSDDDFGRMLLTGPGSQGEQDVVKAFFEERTLEIETRKGFYAKPILGACAIRLKIDEFNKDPNSDPKLSRIRDLVQNSDMRVGLVGSMFGGTGAGAMPILANEIKSWNENTKVFGVVHYKWFNLTGSHNLEEARRTREDELESNTHAGTYYYSQVLGSDFDRLNVLSLDYEIPRGADDDGKQKANWHFLILMTTSILHFYSGLHEDEFQKFRMEGFSLDKQMASLKDIKFRTSGYGLFRTDDRNNDWHMTSEKETLDFFWRLSHNTVQYLDWLCFILEEGKVEGGQWIKGLFPKEFEKLYDKSKIQVQEFARALEVKSRELRASLHWLAQFNNDPQIFIIEVPREYQAIEPALPPTREGTNNDNFFHDLETRFPARFRKEKKWIKLLEKLSEALEEVSNTISHNPKEAAETFYNEIRFNLTKLM